ncbi:zinc-ribbon domain-containing protein [Jeotgalibaca porci]|uniref:Zinc-ribbon domain-containing protein n=1 Tax=Jeotgalibaca porci TaxID=1868793 RepID=A0A6G7WG66_9LACT|nr:zinc ribbon domain-containing protein [Jeotgalibaca porci]QIK51246.1 zinc-ribbon domain-containing protein [Jeotgalibaca porci]
MIICPNCQAEIKEGNKFCTECGTPLTEQAANQKAQAPTSQITITAPNIDLTNVKERMGNYWQYLLQSAVNPSSSFANSKALMGWIQIAVLSLLTTLTLAVFLNDTYMYLSFIDFIKVFVVQTVATLCPILIGYLVVRFIKKNPITFGQVTAQLGGLLSLNVFIWALVFVFSLLSPFGLMDIILLLIGLTGIINVAAFNVYLYSTENHSKVDSFITTIMGNIGYLILVMIIGRILLGMFIKDFSGINIFEELMYEFF